MRFTRKTVILATLEMWEPLAENGSNIKVTPEWEQKWGHCENDCALCEYVEDRLRRLHYRPNRCAYCPYQAKYGYCAKNLTMPYVVWWRARSVTDRMAAASQVFEQLKALLEPRKKGDSNGRYSK